MKKIAVIYKSHYGIPNWSSLDLRENTYVAQHDPGQGRKFILFYDEHDKLQGTFGEFGSNAIKGLCAICQEMTTISLFLATTKSSGDGTYTKKGIISAQIQMHVISISMI